MTPHRRAWRPCLLAFFRRGQSRMRSHVGCVIPAIATDQCACGDSSDAAPNEGTSREFWRERGEEQRWGRRGRSGEERRGGAEGCGRGREREERAEGRGKGKGGTREERGVERERRSGVRDGMRRRWLLIIFRTIGSGVGVSSFPSPGRTRHASYRL